MPDTASVIAFASFQTDGPPPDDPTNVITRYLLEHPIMASATLSHQDTAAILYLSASLQLELLSVPAQAVPPFPGSQRIVGVVGATATPGAPVVIRSLPAAASHTFFAADFTQTEQGEVVFDTCFSLEDGSDAGALVGEGENRVGFFPTVLPLPYGHTVMPGDLFDDAVLASLAATHPFLGFWGGVLRSRVTTGTASMDMPTWLGHLRAENVPEGMMLWYPPVKLADPVTVAVPLDEPPLPREVLWLEAATARIAPFVGDPSRRPTHVGDDTPSVTSGLTADDNPTSRAAPSGQPIPPGGGSLPSIAESGAAARAAAYRRGM